MFKVPTLEEFTEQDALNLKENQYFDRKSADIKPKKLAEALIAFANADGGIVAIGVNNGAIQGIEFQGAQKVNDFIQTKIDCCKPAITTKERFVPVINAQGKEDRILLIQVMPSRDRVHSTMSDKVFLRVGDESKELNIDERLNLEYDKGERLFEEHVVQRCRIEHLDLNMIQKYNEAVKYDGDNPLQLLYARGFIDNYAGTDEITTAGVLLFTMLPSRFLPNARIRFIKFDGVYEKVGVEMNVIKQEYIEGPLSEMIQKAKEVVQAQLREFTSLNPITGKFETVPEYPEFAWQEGIVNAVVHRAYNIQGDDIKIKMFDDRLEIISPGRFPNIVNRNNIREVRYSRNPSMARVLTELGWVREFGEGVKRIYKEMDSFFLEEPEYLEEQNSVRLILKNNIVMRKLRSQERVKHTFVGEWENFTPDERRTLEYIFNKEKVTTKELADVLVKSTTHAKKVLRGLCEKNILELVRNSVNDPNQHYIFKN